MFSVEAQDLITEMEKKKKVRITAWLYPSWLLSSLFRLPNRSASAGRLTKKQCDFQKAGWQRGQDEEHSSTAVCYHFPFTNGVNLEGRERGHSGKQVPLCHFKKKKKRHRVETGEDFSAVTHFFHGKYFICEAGLIRSFPLVYLMWGCLHARSLSAFHGRTEQWKKKKKSLSIMGIKYFTQNESDLFFSCRKVT